MSGTPGRIWLERSPEEREALWEALAHALETHQALVDAYPVSPGTDPEAVRSWLSRFTFETALPPKRALALAVEGLTRFGLHTAHRRYFGVFNPAPSSLGIAADTLVAAFNPQLASWVSSPFGIEVEALLLREFGERFGYPKDAIEGTFTSGGTEANHTALLTALTSRFPEFARSGARGLPGLPLWYVSEESHHSFLKAARLSGLGYDSARVIPVDDRLHFDVAALKRQIASDRAEGHQPFFLVATLGSTSAGVVDPVRDLAQVAREENLWLHLDAAWGGAAILLPEMTSLFEGSGASDSLTLDAHKWLSVPMGAGLFVTRHPGALEKTFRVDVSYMYKPETSPSRVHHPYQESMAWSRRLIGLKLFLTLACAGWDGYRETLRHQVAMGDELRRRLSEDGWRITNETPLPVVCFVDGTSAHGALPTSVEAIAHDLNATGKAWVTTTKLHFPGTAGVPVLRAGISSYRTESEDLAALVAALGEARARASVS